MKYGSHSYRIFIIALTLLYPWLYFDSNLNFISWDPWDHRPSWFTWWLGAEQASRHYLHQWWHSSLTHTCVIRPQGIKLSHYIICTLWNMVSLRIHGIYKYIECFCIYMAPNIAVRLSVTFHVPMSIVSISVSSRDCLPGTVINFTSVYSFEILQCGTR